MRDFILYITVVLFTVISLIYMIDYKNKIKDLQNKNNSLDYALKFQKEQCQYHVQDLMLKIDSLEKELIFYEPQSIEETIDEILNAIISVESSGRNNAYNAKEDAVGCLQIRQTMVNEMFNIFIDYYNLNTAEAIARGWNGGPRGVDRKSTLNYWEKVQGYLDS